MMLTNIFYYTDKFCKFFEKEAEKNINLDEALSKFKSRMTLSEVMTIMTYWHLSGLKNFKHFYNTHILEFLHKDFPRAVSYTA